MNKYFTLKQLRKKSKLTQKDVAKALKRTQGSISLLEQGKRIGTRLYRKEIEKLAKLYNCSDFEIYRAIEKGREEKEK